MRLLAAFVFLPCAGLAQASIQGLVLDPTGAAVPDASIAAMLDATGATRNARTDADGRYRLPALSIGTYTIRCEKSGFQRAEVPQVYLALNQTLEQTIQLKLATAGSTIDVREQPEALNTTAPNAGTGISGEVLEETPSQNRSYLGVVLLAPGVAAAAGSNTLRTKAGIRSATPDSGFTFAGMRARATTASPSMGLTTATKPLAPAASPSARRPSPSSGSPPLTSPPNSAAPPAAISMS
jgi:hypothetical protein